MVNFKGSVWFAMMLCFFAWIKRGCLKLGNRFHLIDDLYKKHLLTNDGTQVFFVELSQWGFSKNQFETAPIVAIIIEMSPYLYHSRDFSFSSSSKKSQGYTKDML